MPWIQFLQQNAPALLTLIGVALGGLIAGTVSFLTMSLQRHWQVKDQRLEWRRRSLQEKLALVIAWQEQWIKLAAHVRSIEGMPEEANRWSKRARQAQLKRMDETFSAQGNYLRELFAITVPLVAAIGDPRLRELDTRFRDVAASYTNILEARDVESAIKANVAVVMGIAQVNAETRQRADELLIQTFSQKT